MRRRGDTKTQIGLGLVILLGAAAGRAETVSWPWEPADKVERVEPARYPKAPAVVLLSEERFTYRAYVTRLEAGRSGQWVLHHGEKWRFITVGKPRQFSHRKNRLHLERRPEVSPVCWPHHHTVAVRPWRLASSAGARTSAMRSRRRFAGAHLDRLAVTE
jgi:hypothetical protein